MNMKRKSGMPGIVGQYRTTLTQMRCATFFFDLWWALRPKGLYRFAALRTIADTRSDSRSEELSNT